MGANQSGHHVRRGPVFHRPETQPDPLGGLEPGAPADSAKAQDTYAPLNRESWYTHTGDTGVIARYADPKEPHFLTH